MNVSRLSFLSILLALGCMQFGGSLHADNLQVGDLISLVRHPDNPGLPFRGGAFNVIRAGTVLFPTFCVETAETFSPGATYEINDISHEIINDGDSSSISLLSGETAYLYLHARKGTLAGFAWDDPTAQKDLQEAIWHFEGEGGYGGISNSFVTMFGAGGPSSADILAAHSLVRVFNPVNPGTAIHRQSQLTIVPEPCSLLLLGMSLLGLGSLAARRRRRV